MWEVINYVNGGIQSHTQCRFFVSHNKNAEKIFEIGVSLFNSGDVV